MPLPSSILLKDILALSVKYFSVLQDLYLKSMGVPAIFNGNGGSSDDDDSVDLDNDNFCSPFLEGRAGTEMSKVLRSLPSLTSLRLGAVLFDVLPEHGAGNLTNLRQALWLIGFSVHCHLKGQRVVLERFCCITNSEGLIRRDSLEVIKRLPGGHTSTRVTK